MPPTVCAHTGERKQNVKIHVRRVAFQTGRIIANEWQNNKVHCFPSTNYTCLCWPPPRQFQKERRPLNQTPRPTPQGPIGTWRTGCEPAAYWGVGGGDREEGVLIGVVPQDYTQRLKIISELMTGNYYYTLKFHTLPGRENCTKKKLIR